MKKGLLFILFVSMAFTSCQKTIVKDDIYGVWTLQNEVEFKAEAWGLLEVKNDTDIWIDPCISKTDIL